MSASVGASVTALITILYVVIAAVFGVYLSLELKAVKRAYTAERAAHKAVLQASAADYGRILLGRLLPIGMSDGTPWYIRLFARLRVEHEWVNQLCGVPYTADQRFKTTTWMALSGRLVHRMFLSSAFVYALSGNISAAVSANASYCAAIPLETDCTAAAPLYPPNTLLSTVYLYSDDTPSRCVWYAGSTNSDSAYCTATLTAAVESSLSSSFTAIVTLLLVISVCGVLLDAVLEAALLLLDQCAAHKALLAAQHLFSNEDERGAADGGVMDRSYSSRGASQAGGSARRGAQLYSGPVAQCLVLLKAAVGERLRAVDPGSRRPAAELPPTVSRPVPPSNPSSALSTGWTACCVYMAGDYDAGVQWSSGQLSTLSAAQQQARLQRVRACEAAVLQRVSGSPADGALDRDLLLLRLFLLYGVDSHRRAILHRYLLQPLDDRPSRDTPSMPGVFIALLVLYIVA